MVGWPVEHIKTAVETPMGPQLVRCSYSLLLGQVLALRAHCIHTTHAKAEILTKNTGHLSSSTAKLRTQRLRYSPKNTGHLSSNTAKQQSPDENNETTFKLGNQLSL